MNTESHTLPFETEYDDLYAGEPVVEIQGLSRRFGKNLALNNVSLKVPRGVVMGLVGLNGAGKTTLLKHVMGLLRAQSGSVNVFGVDPSHDPTLALSRIGYLTEEDTLPGWMKVWQLLRFSKPFYPNWDDEYAQELVDIFKIPLDKKISKLSKGQRARCGLITALAHKPELLVLDEPSSGLDPIVRHDILTAVIRTIAEQGRTVLFSSHLLDEVQRVSDLVGVIRNGELVEFGPLESLRTRYQRVTLQMPQTHDSSSPPPLDVLGQWERSATDWVGVMDVEGEDLFAVASSINAEVISSEGVSLSEWFLKTSR